MRDQLASQSSNLDDPESLAKTGEDSGAERSKSLRPAIPREVAREIRVEAGHRCSVCGATSSLEIAHIIPWKVSKSHEPENLILLCANCHGRADRERWDKKDLVFYKENPWVANNKALAPVDENVAQVVQIEIIFKHGFKEFGEVQENLTRYSLAGFLGISPNEVRIVKKEEGSVRLVIELPEGSEEKVLENFRVLQEAFLWRLRKVGLLLEEAESQSEDVLSDSERPMGENPYSEGSGEVSSLEKNKHFARQVLKRVHLIRRLVESEDFDSNGRFNQVSYEVSKVVLDEYAHLIVDENPDAYERLRSLVRFKLAEVRQLDDYTQAKKGIPIVIKGVGRRSRKSGQDA